MIANAANITAIESPATQFTRAADVAAILGLNVDHVSKLCRSSWRTFARQFPTEGGKPQWAIFTPFVESERRRRNAESTGAIEFTDVKSQSEKKRGGAMARAAIARKFDQQMERGIASKVAMATAIQFAAAEFGLNPTAAAVYRWRNILRDHCGDVAALADTRGGSRGQKVSQDAIDFFLSHYITPNHPAMRRVWKLTRDAAAAHGWQWCGYSNLKAQIDRWMPRQEREKIRRPEVYRTRYAPTVQRDPESYAAGQMALGDHKLLDLICRSRDGLRLFRPWLTLWLDWRTRKVLGWSLNETPNSSTILAALRDAILNPENNGGPSAVTIDNGKDFAARVFAGMTKAERRQRRGLDVDEMSLGLFKLLSIEHHFTDPYSPQSKGRIETHFRNYTYFAQQFATYTGDKPETKPEDLNTIVKSGAAVPTFDAVETSLRTYIERYNADADHAMEDLIADDGRKLSPAVAFASWCQTKRLFNAEAVDLLMAKTTKPLFVGKNGVRVMIGGEAHYFGQFDPILAKFKGAQQCERSPVVVFYDPHDLSTVRVHRADGSYLCTVEKNKRIGSGRLAEADIAEAAKRKRQYNRVEKKASGLRIQAALRPDERAEVVAAERVRNERAEAARLAADSQPNLRLVQTPLDGQAARINARRQRRVVNGPTLVDDPSNDPQSMFYLSPDDRAATDFMDEVSFEEVALDRRRKRDIFSFAEQEVQGA